MHLYSTLALLGAVMGVAAQGTNSSTVTGKLGDARPVRNNPVIGETWVATFDKTVQGTVTAIAATVGIDYIINVTGLVVDKGPYSTPPTNLSEVLC
jgi:hypothetical protein